MKNAGCKYCRHCFYTDSLSNSPVRYKEEYYRCSRIKDINNRLGFYLGESSMLPGYCCELNKNLDCKEWEKKEFSYDD